jgi:Zn ribbon nucleic-acid-binding protein
VSRNVDLVRAAFDAGNRNDLDGWLAVPALISRSIGPASSLTSNRSIAGAMEPACFRRNIHEPWRELKVDLEEVDEKADCLVVSVRFRATAENGSKSISRSSRPSGFGTVARSR